MATEIIEAEIKTNIGDLAKGIEKTGKATKELAKDTKELGTETEKVGDAAKGTKKSFGIMGKAVKGVGTAFKALGIIAIVTAAFTALKEAMERNQKVMNIVNTIMTTISTTFNQVISVLTDTVKWVTESTDRFDALGTVFESIGTIIKNVIMIAFTPLRLAVVGTKTDFAALQLGWEMLFGDDESIKAAQQHLKDTAKEFIELKDSLVNSVKEIGSAGKAIGGSIGEAIGEIAAVGKKAYEGISEISIAANYAQAEATTAAQNSALLAEAQIQGLIEKNDRLSELQRQIRDDETKTFAERIAANKELGEILNTQEVEMLKLADIRVAAAAMELAQNKENIELQVAYQQTLNDRAGVEAQIAGLRSEQLTNTVGLNKELIEVENELALVGKTNRELELAELEQAYILKQELARKAGQDTTLIDEEYRIAKAEIDATYDEAELEQAKVIAAAKAEVAFAMVDAIAANIQQSLDERSEALEAEYSREMELAKGNEKEQAKIEKKFEARRKIEAKKAKKLQVALALIDTFKGAAGAYTSMIGVPYVGPVLAPIAAGAALLAGMANVRKIMKTDVGGGGGGGAGGGGGGGAAPPPAAEAAPPAPGMMSGKFELGGGEEPDPIKAFVVTDEMTNSQDQLDGIRRESTL